MGAKRFPRLGTGESNGFFSLAPRPQLGEERDINELQVIVAGVHAQRLAAPVEDEEFSTSDGEPLAALP